MWEDVFSLFVTIRTKVLKVSNCSAVMHLFEDIECSGPAAGEMCQKRDVCGSEGKDVDECRKTVFEKSQCEDTVASSAPGCQNTLSSVPGKGGCASQEQRIIIKSELCA
jgi:hypothetical protein